MQGLIAFLYLPIMLLNIVGGLVSGVWLLLLGEWWAVGYGVFALFSPLLLGLILFPGFVLGVPARLLLERGRIGAALPIAIVAQFYAYVVMGGWCLLVFYGFMDKVNEASMWPLLIWSYGVALGPWMYLSGRQADKGAGSVIAILSMQAAYLTMIVLYAMGNHTYTVLAETFSAIMLAGLCVQLVLMVMVALEEKKRKQHQAG